MRAIIICIAIMFASSVIRAQDKKEYANQQGYVSQAKRFINKMGLKEENMYYVSRQDMLAKYHSSGYELEFPNNHIYDRKGDEMKLRSVLGVIWQPLANIKYFDDDVDKFFDDSSTHRHIFDGGTFAWIKKNIKPIFAPEIVPLADYNVVVYYPMGTPLIKKYYNRLMTRIRHYRESGKHINIYFVMVPIMDQPDNVGTRF